MNRYAPLKGVVFNGKFCFKQTRGLTISMLSENYVIAISKSL